MSRDAPESKRDRSRPYAAANLWASFRHAWAGIAYAFRTQRNFRFHALVALLAVGLCLGLRVSPVEGAIVIVTIALVMALELLNTAVEAVVDLTIGDDYHELAKIAKDCAAAAVLLAALGAIAVAACIFGPPLLALVLGL